VDIRIDRLRVQVAGMNPDTARQFGRLFAEHLAAAMAATPPGPGGAPRLTSLRVSVPEPAGPNPRGLAPAALAPAAAAEVSRALRTVLTGAGLTGTGLTGTAAAGTEPTAHPGGGR
jgi:hypothetical protein